MPQQHIAKWRGEGDGRSLYQNSSTVSGPGWLWQETNNRTNTRIRKQTKWRTECKKKKDITLCKWVGSWELQCLPRKDHFNLNGSELRGFLIKDRFGKKKKKRILNVLASHVVACFCCHYQRPMCPCLSKLYVLTPDPALYLFSPNRRKHTPIKQPAASEMSLCFSKVSWLM